MAEILPISRAQIKNQKEKTKAEKVAEELKVSTQNMETIIEEVPSESQAKEPVEEVPEPTQDELFVKPKKIKIIDDSNVLQEVEEEEAPKKKKKKRVLSELQLNNLKKAREKSMARRKEIKEAKAMATALKKDDRQAKKDERMREQEKTDEMILLKARLVKEAEAKGVWDEKRIEALMEKTLNTYIDKRKKDKLMPKTHIPAQQAYPQFSPQQTQHMNGQYYGQQTHQPPQQPKPRYMNNKQYPHPNDNVMKTLFGGYGQY